MKRIGNVLRQLCVGEASLRQVVSRFKMRYFNRQSDLKDDFDWTEYHNHYREELRILEKRFTLMPSPRDFDLVGGQLRRVSDGVKPLHDNHSLLYGTILSLKPSSVMEVGCGGGDHLSVLQAFAPRIELTGLDRSTRQFETLRKRHPQLSAKLEVFDVSAPGRMPTAELVYTQAVLMHISEDGGRFMNALRNVFGAAQSHVVLMENWRQHNFFDSVVDVLRRGAAPSWSGGRIYVRRNVDNPDCRIMVVSKSELPFDRLEGNAGLLG